MTTTPARGARPSTSRPRTVLAALLLAAVTGGTATAPAVAGTGVAVETVTGDVVRAWAEGTHDGEPELRAWIETSAEAVPVAPDAVEHVPAGATVRASVVEESGTAAGDEPREVVQTEVLTQPAGDVAAAAGAHLVDVVLAVPKDGAKDSMTLSGLVDTVNGPVSAFWSQQTGGRLSYSVNQRKDWVALSAPCSEPLALWREAARHVGFSEQPGRHLLVYVGASAGCYAGLGTVGSGIDDGGLAYVRGGSGMVSLIAHELGHNAGLGHSDGLLCGSVADGAYSGTSWGSGCRRVDYRDWYDVMGVSWRELGSLSVAHADHLGVMGAGVQAVSAPTRATLAPVSGLDGVRALRVTDPAGPTYYVEYRPAAGRDAFITAHAHRMQPGVLVRRATGDGGTVLLDPTPTGSDQDWAQALVDGQRLTTASGRVAIAVEAAGDVGATVTVSVDGVSPPPVAELVVPPEPVADTSTAFADVPVTGYYYEAVTWAAQQGITTGTSATTFSPKEVVTRAQATSMLWRSQDQPAPAGPTASFDDVVATSYYAPAVAWASSRGITSGTSPGIFSPRNPVTREQAVTLLWRMAGKPTPVTLAQFSDVPPGSYAEAAIAWAKEAGITSGTAATEFSPAEEVTRAQMATFLYRLLTR